MAADSQRGEGDLGEAARSSGSPGAGPALSTSGLTNVGPTSS